MLDDNLAQGNQCCYARHNFSISLLAPAYLAHTVSRQRHIPLLPLLIVLAAGRWLLMIGFGAIFGNTVMTRFTLLIDRMYFVWIEWLIQGIFHK